jgi:multiple sugar transport system permease protein
MAFLLFGIIILMTMIQRFIMRDKDAIAEKKALKRQQAQRRAQVSVGSGGAGTGSGTGVQA